MASWRYDERDGPYAYVIMTSSFIANLLINGVILTTGVFYSIFVEVLPEKKVYVAFIAAVNPCFYYLAGPLASFLTNRYGTRVVMMLGSFIGSSGLILSIFATNVYTLFVTFGFITGYGLGLCYLPCVTILGDYFEKRRSIALGIAGSGVGLGQFTHPPMIRYFVNNYGWQGSLLLLAGVTLNLCVCAALSKPFESKNSNRNTVKIETNGKSSEENKTDNMILSVNGGNSDNNCMSYSTDLDTSDNKGNLSNVVTIDKSEDIAETSISNGHINKENGSKLLHRKLLDKIEGDNGIHASVESLVSLSKIQDKQVKSGSMLYVDGAEKPEISNSKFTSMNTHIFKNFAYQLVNINNLGLCFSISIVFVHLAAYASSTGVDTDSSALLFTIIGLCSFIARITFGVISQMNIMSDITLFCISFTIAGMVTCLCPLYSNYYWLACYAGMFGFFTGCFGTLTPGIMIAILELKYLKSAFGYNLVFCAVGTVIGAPMAGWLYESTGAYRNSLFLGGALMLFSCLLIYPLCSKKVVQCCDTRTPAEPYMSVKTVDT